MPESPILPAYGARALAIRVSLMPKDTHVHGTIFGGILLSYLDIAGAIATRPYCDLVVTVKMTEVIFHEPVYVGDIVSYYTTITRIGRTSITVHVAVEAQRFSDPGMIVQVTVADIVYVNVGQDRRPTPITRRPEGSI
jgi:acyl-CoA thioesterase YciA